MDNDRTGDAKKLSANETPHPIHTNGRKRKRFVTLPPHVAAHYNKRRVREGIAESSTQRGCVFDNVEEKRNALNALRSCREQHAPDGISIGKGPPPQNKGTPPCTAPVQGLRCENSATNDNTEREIPVPDITPVGSVGTNISGHGSEDNSAYRPHQPPELPQSESEDESPVRGNKTHEMDDQGLISQSSDDDRDDHGEEEEEQPERELSDGEEQTNSIVCKSRGPPESNDEQLVLPIPKLQNMKRRMETIVKWEQMLSCVSVSGTVRLNHVQYKFLVDALKTQMPTLKIRAYAGVDNKFWKAMVGYAAAKSQLIHLSDRNNTDLQTDKVYTANAGLRNVRDCVRIVFPSEWAKLDIITDGFFKSVYEQVDVNHPDIISIENSPIIQHRRLFCGAEIVLWALYDDAVCPCETGDHVTFNCHKLVRTGKTTLSESMWTVTPVQGTPYSIINGFVGPLWCVRQVEAEEVRQLEGCTENELKIFKLLQRQQFTSFESVSRSANNQRTLQESSMPNLLQLCVGDVCMFLRAHDTSQGQNDNSVHCLLVGSPVSHTFGGSIELLVWVSLAVNRDGETYVKTVGQRAVRGLPKWISGKRTLPVPKGRRMRNKGYLPCGTQYYVYRIALYADAFKQFKSLANTKSVVGVYLLPLGLPSRRRRSSDAARVVTVVPDGQDVRTVFQKIEDDLIAAATEGIIGKDPYGNVARIFVDPVSFYGDYPAVTSMTDVRGHTATAFCTFCTMRRRNQAAGRSLLHLSQAHSRRLGYMRFDERTYAIRASNPPKDVLQALGLAKDSGQTLHPAEEAPLVHYAKRVRELDRRRMKSAPVLSIDFDPCLNVAAAPDHLFTGLIGDALFVCMMTMDSDRRREEAEVEIIHAARTNGLPHEKKFLRWEGAKCAGLVSLTMTTKLCLLFCAVPIFEREYKRTRDVVFQLPGKLQHLISLAFVVPSEEAQGPWTRELCSEKGTLKVQGELNRTVRQYIGMCDKIFRGTNPYGKELNKPNVHRALELCVLTIPSFGHARNCSEMVLESMHRTVKRWLEKNSHANSHITSVEHALLRDWLSRLHKLYNQLVSTNDEDFERAQVGLIRLLLGEKALGLRHDTNGVHRFLIDFRVAMANAFRAPVLAEMGRCDHFGEGSEGAYAWELSGLVERGDDQTSQSLENGLDILESYYEAIGKKDVDFYERRVAKYIVQDATDGKRRCYQHNVVSRGAAVSIVTRTRETATSVVRGCSMDDPRGELQLFAVHELLHASNGDAWCTAKQLSRTGEGDGYCVGDNPVVVLELGRRVRRAAVLHICGNNCRVLVSKRQVKHDRSLLRGGTYEIKTRVDGYPPHVG